MPSAWSRLYLRDASPSLNPGETSLSPVLTAGPAVDFVIGVKSLSPVRGTSTVSAAGNSLAGTSHEDDFFTSFSSPPLQAGTYGAGTWSYGISCSEANGNANSFFAFSVYVYRPSTAAIVGMIYDSDTALGTEWGTLQRGRGGTFTGSGVAALAGDILVVEVWRHTPGQAAATAYAQTIYYDGATDIADLDFTIDAASWIQAPHEIGFSPRLRGVMVN